MTLPQLALNPPQLGSSQKPREGSLFFFFFFSTYKCERRHASVCQGCFTAMLHIVLNDRAGEGQGGSRNLYIALGAVIQPLPVTWMQPCWTQTVPFSGIRLRQIRLHSGFERLTLTNDLAFSSPCKRWQRSGGISALSTAYITGVLINMQRWFEDAVSNPCFMPEQFKWLSSCRQHCQLFASSSFIILVSISCIFV